MCNQFHQSQRMVTTKKYRIRKHWSRWEGGSLTSHDSMGQIINRWTKIYTTYPSNCATTDQRSQSSKDMYATHASMNCAAVRDLACSITDTYPIGVSQSQSDVCVISLQECIRELSLKSKEDDQVCQKESSCLSSPDTGILYMKSAYDPSQLHFA